MIPRSILDLPGRLGVRLLHADPALTALSAAAMGALLLALSVPCNLFMIRCPESVCAVPRSVGYFTAINWSFNYIVLFPIVIFFFLTMLQNGMAIVDKLASAQMLINSRGRVTDGKELKEALHGRIQARGWIIFAFLLIALFASVVEWYIKSGAPLLFGVGEPPQLDWSVGSLLRGEPTAGLDAWSNAAFALLVTLLLQVPAVTLFLTFVFAAIPTYASVFYQACNGRFSTRIVPNVASSDREGRAGFEILEEYAEGAILTALFIVLMCYLTVIYNEYIHREEVESLHQLLLPWLALGSQAVKPDLEFLPKMFAEFTPNYSANMVSLGGILGVTLGAAFCLVFLRFGAKASQSWALAYLLSGKTLPSMKGDPREYEERLRNMRLWPFGYWKLNTAILLGLAGAFTLVWYPLMTFLIGVVFAFVVVRLVEMMWKTSTA